MRRAALVLALTALGAPPALAAPATVDVQVEGAAGPVVPTTTVRTTTASVVKDGVHACSGTSAAGALEQAAGGDWGGPWIDGFGYAVERVRTETHPLDPPSGRRFSLYVDGLQVQDGPCATELAEGADVLWYVACDGAADGCFAEEPLVATAPRRPVPGRPFRVTVREATTQSGTTTLAPSAGASVNGAPTDEEGTTPLVLGRRGPQLITVTKGGRPPERVPVCVTDGRDGACGTTAAGPGPAEEDGPDGAAALQPRARWQTPRDGQAFPKGGGPAFLRGDVVAEGAGVDVVRMRLTRRAPDGRCWALDPARERQVRRKRCGARGGIWVELGNRVAFSYVMPFTTPPGRYVLDVQVRDRAGRVSRLERGNTRAVFTVR
jgi:hypothetical protein